MGRVDIFATTKPACKRMLRLYHRYLTERIGTLFGFLRDLPVIGTQLPDGEHEA
jgi:hypothetical protein